MNNPADIIKETAEGIVKPVAELTDNLHTSRQEDEGERTERLYIDMNSDNLLSKIVRPAVLIYLLLLYTALAFVDMLTGFEIDPAFILIIERWGDLAFMFYFTSRGLEKITKEANRQVRRVKRIEARKERQEARQERKAEKPRRSWFRRNKS